MLDLPDEHRQRGGGRRAEAPAPSARKGVGETGTFGVSPAIANAIHDAVGVRLTALPMSAEAVFMAMQDEMRREIRFRLNGEAVSAQVAPHENLVEVLQESFGLYGARESCGQGHVRLLHRAGRRPRGFGLPLSAALSSRDARF